MTDVAVGMVLAAGGYVLGSIPFALVVGKWFYGIDVREHGSGNVGTTNVFRVLGTKAGAVVMLLDMGKGFLPAFLAHLYFGGTWAAVAIAVMPVVGHMRSIFLHGKGGKGVATGSGVVLALMWPIFLIVLVIWVSLVVATRYVSVASIAAAASFATLTFVFDQPTAYRVAAVAVSAFVIYAHRGNIVRLLSGTENRITLPWAKKKQPLDSSGRIGHGA